MSRIKQHIILKEFEPEQNNIQLVGLNINIDKEKQDYIHIIGNNNEWLLQLINDILDLSKIDAGTLDCTYTDVNMNGLLHELQLINY